MKTKFVRALFVLLAVGLGSVGALAAGPAGAGDLKRGLYIHWDLEVLAGIPYEGAKTKDLGQIPAAVFDKTNVDARAWARAARKAGMTFTIFTAKHEGGFAWWPSKESDYSVANSAAKTDVLAAYIAGCKAEGILPGVYYALVDVHNEGEFRKGPIGPPFFQYVKRQVAELVTSYPDLRVISFDYTRKLTEAQYKELCETVTKANPNCVILSDQPPPSTQSHTVATVIRGWFWRPDAQFIPATRLYGDYAKNLPTGRPFLLSVGVDKDGVIPEKQIDVLTEVNEMIVNGPPKTEPQTAQTLPGAGPQAKPSAADRIKQIKSLFDQGLISKEDYDKKVKEIVDSL